MSEGERRSSSSAVSLPGGGAGPLRKIGRRVAIALVLITFVALITYVGRDGYIDPEGGEISLLDAFYYSTVSITTTGYGDILPASDGARLATTVLVTPARVLFLILLVGTTLEILAERSRHAYRVARWRRRLRDHTIVCGYGTKGKSAVATLLGKGIATGEIVVIERSQTGRDQAKADGLAAIEGDATSTQTLTDAGIKEASAVIVAVDRDDTAVMTTLTARELNTHATIVVAVREEEKVHLAHQSGANAVITSSSAAGRLLGHSTRTPQVTEVMEDMLTVGRGLDVAEREVGAEDAGPLPQRASESMIIAVVREGQVLRFDDPRAAELREGDRVVELFSHREAVAQ